MAKYNAFIIIIFSLLYFAGCSEDPTSIGGDYLNQQNLKLDTLISNNAASIKTIYQPINLNGSKSFLVGKTSDLEAWSLIQFAPKWVGYSKAIRKDSLTIVSAKILMYQSYKFGNMDSLNGSNFDMSAELVNYNWIPASFTSDSIGKLNSTNINIKTTVTDSLTTLEILDESVVLNWLKASASIDTPIVGVLPNYGIVLKPKGVSNRIVGFKSSTFYTLGFPILELKIKKPVDGTTDSNYYSLNYGTHVVMPEGTSTIADNIILSSGRVSRGFITFALDGLPENSIINYAQLKMYSDGTKTQIGSISSNYANVYLGKALSDSIDGSVSPVVLSGSNDSLTANISSLVNHSYYNLKTKELKLVLRNTYYYDGVERFTFFDNNCADASKRPTLKIYYSRRAN